MDLAEPAGLEGLVGGEEMEATAMIVSGAATAGVEGPGGEDGTERRAVRGEMEGRFL